MQVLLYCAWFKHAWFPEEVTRSDQFCCDLQGQSSSVDPVVSPEGVAHLSQHRLLPLLHAHATAAHSQASIHFGHKVIGLHQDQDAVSITIESQASSVKQILLLTIWSATRLGPGQYQAISSISMYCQLGCITVAALQCAASCWQ